MTVSFSGPLFDGTASKLLAAGMDAAEQDLAVDVRDLVRQLLRASARKRTGYYESHVRVDHVSGDSVVTDSGVVYADWLGRGDTPRNRSTGFPGYRLFERAKQQLEPQATGIAERVLDPYIDRMR
jgi:hypothetical protein